MRSVQKLYMCLCVTRYCVCFSTDLSIAEHLIVSGAQDQPCKNILRKQPCQHHGI